MEHQPGYEISIVSCPDYKEKLLRERIVSLLDPLGGMNNFVKKGDNVALKPNLLMAAAPSRRITTHPEIVRVVSDLVKEAGGEPFVVDSPGAAIQNTPSSLDRVYNKCGLQNVGLKLNRDTSRKFISHPKARVAKKIEVLQAVCKADVIINLPKIKPHCFMILTCAVKNMFGIIPGLIKVGYHSKLSNPERFGAMLLDLNDFFPPALTIIDGITGMEGDGPSSGTPVKIGALLAGTDDLKLDLAVCQLIGFSPDDVPYLKIAMKEGICPESADELNITDRPLFKKLSRKIAPPSTINKGSGFSRGIIQKLGNRLMNYAFTLNPEVDTEKCVGCGACERGCPENIITFYRDKKGRKKARISERNKCIHCYCCHEMCPHRAMGLKPSLLYRVLIRK